MKSIDGRKFWLYVDGLIAMRGLSLGDLCKQAEINYNTLSYQRVRRALPKIEQLLSMSEVLGLSVEKLVYGDEYKEFKLTPRVMNIAKRCMIASDEDLSLVERVLRIETDSGEKSSARSGLA